MGLWQDFRLILDLIVGVLIIDFYADFWAQKGQILAKISKNAQNLPFLAPEIGKKSKLSKLPQLNPR